MQLRDYTFLGMTQSLCPDCLRLVPAKILDRAGRVYFRKTCPEHGVREDFVCSDVRWFDRHEFSVPGKIPPVMGIEPNRGCPYDCGLCTEHEQHTCIGLLEITSSCNLHCPMCFAASGPGGMHLTFEECRRAIDRLVEVEGRPEVLQLSGGEPTIHPQFLDIFRYACEQPIDIVMINTNGVRFAHDDGLIEAVAELRHRCEIYFQLDGLTDASQVPLRGEKLLDIKLRAIERLGAAGIRVILVSTVQPGVNDGEMGALVEFGVARPFVTGVSFQPATYVGRYVLPDELERRITFPDILRGVEEQTGGTFAVSDFLPLPCAHPNAHTISYAYRSAGQATPLSRFVDLANHTDLLSGGITFNRPRAKKLIEEFLSRQCCKDGSCGPVSLDGNGSRFVPQADPLAVISLDSCCTSENSSGVDLQQQATAFFAQAMAEELSPADVFRITTTSFMDAYNFDVRQLMKSCVHHILPSGHLIPFSAYNVLYRDGHVSLPELKIGGAVGIGSG